MNSLVKLLQLVSPSLPTGAFSYSQGLEWAVEAGWVKDRDSLSAWLQSCLHNSLIWVDIPLLHLMYRAAENTDIKVMDKHIDLLLSCRESYEFQEEEKQRGRATAVLLENLGLLPDKQWQCCLQKSQLAGFTYGAASWAIPLKLAATGYLWAWIENQVLAGVKIIPLGQTAGQQILLELGENLESIAMSGLTKKEIEIGSSSPALAIASSLHETQYTRLYRS